MKPDATKFFVCPTCRGDLKLSSTESGPEIETGSLACAACDKSYPVVRGVPRFVAGEQYADTFGRQWTRWSVTQQDSMNGSRIFHDRMLRYTGWTPESMAGKVVVDISNPVTPDFSGLKIGHSTSAAEQIQGAAPGAKVVKAFNTIFAGLFAAPVAETRGVPVFVAGNDEAAVAQVGDLARKAGFSVENAGTLDAARLIEPVGMLNIRFGYGLGKGTAIAPAWVKLAA